MRDLTKSSFYSPERYFPPIKFKPFDHTDKDNLLQAFIREEVANQFQNFDFINDLIDIIDRGNGLDGLHGFLYYRSLYTDKNRLYSDVEGLYRNTVARLLKVFLNHITVVRLRITQDDEITSIYKVMVDREQILKNNNWWYQYRLGVILQADIDQTYETSINIHYKTQDLSLDKSDIRITEEGNRYLYTMDTIKSKTRHPSDISGGITDIIDKLMNDCFHILPEGYTIDPTIATIAYKDLSACVASYMKGMLKSINESLVIN